MSKNHTFLIFIFSIFLYTFCSAFNEDLALCGDCTEVNKGKCTIEVNPGYYVGKGLYKTMKKNYEVILKFSEFPQQTSNMSVCIPSNLKINAPHGYRYICVWSKDLGCQVITPKNGNPRNCALCRTREFTGEPDCPCNETQQQPSYESDRSEHLHSSSMHIMAVVCVTRIIIYLWNMNSSNFC